jgi:hypothetical protein
MFDFLNSLLEAVKKTYIDDSFVADYEIEDGDTVLGMLPEDLKKIWCYMESIGLAVKRMEGAETPLSYQLNCQYDVLEKIFWTSVYAHFDCWLETAVFCLCKGWQIVRCKEDEDEV